MESEYHYSEEGRDRDLEKHMSDQPRYYDPGTGLWIPIETINYDAGNSCLFSYVHQSPDRHEGKPPPSFKTWQESPNWAISAAPRRKEG